MDQEEQLRRLRAVKATYESALLHKANVVGVGIGFRQSGQTLTDEPAIVVSVTHKVPRSQLDPEDVIPRELEGLPVDVQAVGELRAF